MLGGWSRRALLLWTLLLVPAGSAAVVDYCDQAAFPSCLRDFQTCEFDLDYGSTGGALSIGAVHVFGLGTLDNADLEMASGLQLDCSVFDVGTDLMRIRTRVINRTGTTAEQVRVFAFVNPNGNTFTTSQFLYDVPGVSFTGAGEHEPDFYGIDDVANLDPNTAGNIDHEIHGSGLTNTNYCGDPCDVVFALQWSVGEIAQDEAMDLVIGLSDTGQKVSERYLTAARADDTGVPDDPTTVLTFSGRAHVKPFAIPVLPAWGAWPILAGVLVGARGRTPSPRARR